MRIRSLRDVVAVLALLIVPAVALLAQNASYPGLQLDTGKHIYEAACIACHGANGKGTDESIAGFKKPDSFPEFTRCDQTTAEMDNDYRAVIVNGGPFRGFSQIMPSFSEALTPDQINKVIGYLRGFCTEAHWPRAELNLPRALITEKAYPEDETVISTAINARGAPGNTTDIIHEQRFGVKNQIEVDVPVTFQHDNQTWYGGVGDTTLGLKRELFSYLKQGSILAVEGAVILPLGNRTHGLGTGVTTFETFASYGQLFPKYYFLQLQAGALLPVDTAKAPQSVFFNSNFGKSFSQNRGLGRTWSPMVELVATRDLINHSATDWDVVPEFQVTVSRRQHIKMGLGVRTPMTNPAGRPIQAMFYVLWDWQDGKLTEGW